MNRNQHTLCHCKFVSQNENINKAVTTSFPKVDLTGTEKSNSFKERQPDKNKKEIKQIQNVQDTSDENENTSAEATLGSSQQEKTETQTVTLREEKAKIYVKLYSESKIRCMEDLAKPTSSVDPDQLILHVGTNDLPTRKNPDEIAKNIMQ